MQKIEIGGPQPTFLLVVSFFLAHFTAPYLNGIEQGHQSPKKGAGFRALIFGLFMLEIPC